MVVEGIGGIAVPICEKMLVANLAQRFSIAAACRRPP